MYTLAFSCSARGNQFLFSDFYHPICKIYLKKLDKQILFYCNEGEYAGTKQQLSISAALALLEELWDKWFVMNMVVALTFRKGKYFVIVLHAFNVKSINIINMLFFLARQEEVMICVREILP